MDAKLGLYYVQIKWVDGEGRALDGNQKVGWKRWYDVQIKRWMDKEGHYEVEMKGWMEKVAL